MQEQPSYALYLLFLDILVLLGRNSPAMLRIAVVACAPNTTLVFATDLSYAVPAFSRYIGISRQEQPSNASQRALKNNSFFRLKYKQIKNHIEYL